MAPPCPPPGLWARVGLSGRLFLLTVAFVALAEILVYVPIVANFRQMWLQDRIAAAQIAALALDAAPNHRVNDDLARRLLAGVGARSIVVSGGGPGRLLALDAAPAPVAGTVDLRAHSWVAAVGGAWQALFWPNAAPIRVIGSGKDGFERIEIVIDEGPLRAAMADFSIDLLVSSLAIAAAVAGLVFLALQRVIVAPVRQLAGSILAFADDPTRVDRIIVPSRRTDEIGSAERALARMEHALAAELREKRRLAELGLSVSKINHELRNLLTTAQLLSDRLEGVTDPVVQRVAPRLVITLDRAIRFCAETLAYGRATELNARRRLVPLAPIVAEQAELAGLSQTSPIAVTERCPRELSIDADPDQLSRALANLVGNAVQTLAAQPPAGEPPRVVIEAAREGAGVTILVSDNGPGLPELARERLFLPFQGSTREGGSGLGLAIAAELIALNDGAITLDRTEAGARFRIVIRDRIAARA